MIDAHFLSLLLARAGPVLFVGHVFHPVGHFAIELFLNGDVRHSGVIVLDQCTGARRVRVDGLIDKAL